MPRGPTCQMPEIPNSPSPPPTARSIQESQSNESRKQFPPPRSETTTSQDARVRKTAATSAHRTVAQVVEVCSSRAVPKARSAAPRRRRSRGCASPPGQMRIGSADAHSNFARNKNSAYQRVERAQPPRAPQSPARSAARAAPSPPAAATSRRTTGTAAHCQPIESARRACYAAGWCRHRERFQSAALFHLNRGRVGGRLDRRLIHRLNHRGAHIEFSGIHDFQKIEVLVMAPEEIRLKESRAVIVQFAADVPALPPGRLACEFIEIIARDEFRTGGEGVFDQQ